MRTHWGLRFSQGFNTPLWPLGYFIAVLIYSALEKTLNFLCVSSMGILLAQFPSILTSIEALFYLLCEPNLISSKDLLRILVSSLRLLTKIPNTCGATVTPLGLVLITRFTGHHMPDSCPLSTEVQPILSLLKSAFVEPILL